MEIAGSTAMWTRPDSGDSPVSYPAPTYSACKGIPIDSLKINHLPTLYPDSDTGSLRAHIWQRNVISIGLQWNDSRLFQCFGQG